MAFNPIVAIRLAPYYAGLTGWPDYFWKAFGALVSLSRVGQAGGGSLGDQAEDFARADLNRPKAPHHQQQLA